MKLSFIFYIKYKEHVTQKKREMEFKKKNALL